MTFGGLDAFKQQPPPKQYPISESPLLISGVSDDDNSLGSARAPGFRKRRVSLVGTESDMLAPPKRQMQTSDHGFSDENHRALVAAIYEVGVKNASPAVILENMTSKEECITSERVKSHLQKYRQNRTRAKEEFMVSYDRWMRKVRPVESDGTGHQLISPAALLEMMGSDSLTAGEMAASLTYSVIAYDTSMFSMGKREVAGIDFQEGKTSDDYLSHLNSGAALDFPRLTKAEESSTLGQALLHVHSMFTSIAAQVTLARENAANCQVEQSSQHSDGGVASHVEAKRGTLGGDQIDQNFRHRDDNVASLVYTEQGKPDVYQVGENHRRSGDGAESHVVTEYDMPSSGEVQQILRHSEEKEISHLKTEHEIFVPGSGQVDPSLRHCGERLTSNVAAQPGKPENCKVDQAVPGRDDVAANYVVRETRPDVDRKRAATSIVTSNDSDLVAKMPIQYLPPHLAHPVEGMPPRMHQLQQQQSLMQHQLHHQQQFHLHRYQLQTQAHLWSMNSNQPPPRRFGPIPPQQPPPGRFGPAPPYHHLARKNPHRDAG